MLPEKRKRLIIGVISIIVIVIVVILLGKISSFIKNRNTENTPNNDDYSEIYDYIGVSIDKDGVYKVYGISDSEEKYLAVKTFYEVKDIINMDKKVVLYSDAVNEIRYDLKSDEFYFYELDSYYNKNANVKLTKDYLVVIDDENIKYRRYGEESFTILDKYTNYLVSDNKIYYTKNEAIYEYNMATKEEKIVTMYEKNSAINLLAISDKYLFYLSNDVLNACNLENLSNSGITYATFYEITSDGFIEEKNNTLYNYSILKNNYTYNYYVGSTINKVIYLNDNMFYLSYDKNYVIIDIVKGNVWKTLENEYVYLMKVK